MQLYTDKPHFTPDTRQFCVVRHHRAGLKTVWEAHIRASYVADWFIHARGDRRALMATVNVACDGDSLPLGEPDYMIWRTPEHYTNLPGDVIVFRASWPSERELAL